MTEPGKKLALGIVGYGKIARDQHVAAIRESPHFFLHSIADTAESAASIRHYRNIETMLGAADAPDAVAVCTPPQARYAIARRALAHGKHVLLEKPPTATLTEIEDLRRFAAASGTTLFCAWHSRFSPAVAPSREWLAPRRLRRVRIEWREDVRVWHPNQAWIWEPGGFGVFDPGINALSIATEILPKPFYLSDASLRFPENCETPVSAELMFSDAEDLQMTASFDFLEPGLPTRNIDVETDKGRLLLSDGGGRLELDGTEVLLGPKAEYQALYAHFAELIAKALSDVDAVPLRLVADAFMRGHRESAPPFAEMPPA